MKLLSRLSLQLKIIASSRTGHDFLKKEFNGDTRHTSNRYLGHDM